MEGAVLVIGGGIAGIQTSLDLTELGFKVYLVEREPSIGGRMAQLDKVFPEIDCSLCILTPKMIEIFRNRNIELLTYSEVQEVSEKSGNFTAKILKKPRYVDESKCKGCGDCAAKCPKIESPNIFDMNLGKRKSIYIPFLQSVPPTYLIDPTMCLYLNKNVCKVCSKVCKSGAINFEDKPEVFKINIGAIVVATGFDTLTEGLRPRWGYEFKNVVTGLEYERILCATGPFGGKVLRPSDEVEPKKIAFIQCAGSRDVHEDVPYCSSVCCMYTAKQAIVTKEHSENSKCFVFRYDITTYGKNYYDFAQRAQDEFDVEYLDTKVNLIEEDPDTNDLLIYYKDLETKEFKTFRANLVVLATPLIPSKGTQELADILGIKLDEFSFYKGRSTFKKSISSKDGIFISGACQGPKDISETATDASRVATQIACLLNPAKFSRTEERILFEDEKEEMINITPTALIVGGGISGMVASLNIARQGFKTYIVEKEMKLGGNLKKLNLLHPDQRDASQVLERIINKVNEHENVEIYLGSSIKSVSGKIGSYSISIVDSHDKIRDLNVGTIIIATGGRELKPYGLFEYEEGNDNVLTQLELEQKLKLEGVSWLNNINHVTMILCVNARQNEGITYCSNICCGNAIKNIDILKNLKPELKTVVLYRDLQLAKKDYEYYYRERRRKSRFLKYDLAELPKITKIGDDPEKYEIKVKDLYKQDYIKLETDLIVLSTPMIPADGTEELAKMVHIPLDKHGFFSQAHVKLRPLDFATDGIFLCGCAQWPKNIQESTSQAIGAAGRASRFLSAKQLTPTGLKYPSFLLSLECFYKDLQVNLEKCKGCGKCEEICPFNSIAHTETIKDFEDISLTVKKAIINSAICKGCGRCAVICAAKAIRARHFDPEKISTIVEPYFL